MTLTYKNDKEGWYFVIDWDKKSFIGRVKRLDSGRWRALTMTDGVIGTRFKTRQDAGEACWWQRYGSSSRLS